VNIQHDADFMESDTLPLDRVPVDEATPRTGTRFIERAGNPRVVWGVLWTTLSCPWTIIPPRSLETGLATYLTPPLSLASELSIIPYGFNAIVQATSNHPSPQEPNEARSGIRPSSARLEPAKESRSWIQSNSFQVLPCSMDKHLSPLEAEPDALGWRGGWGVTVVKVDGELNVYCNFKRRPQHFLGVNTYYLQIGKPYSSHAQLEISA
jgi:hypothetical protein